VTLTGTAVVFGKEDVTEGLVVAVSLVPVVDEVSADDTRSVEEEEGEVPVLPYISYCARESALPLTFGLRSCQ
jgi:hypothetical protein